MADLLFIGLMIGFFGLAVLLVKACDRIIGVDEDVIVSVPEDNDELEGHEVAA
jgi:hypothetical protein